MYNFYINKKFIKWYIFNGSLIFSFEFINALS